MKIETTFKNFDNRYRPLVEASIAPMERVIPSVEFFEALQDEISKSNGLEGELSTWKNATVKEIFSNLLPMSLTIDTYYTAKDVIAYGMPDDDEIRLNMKYLEQYSKDSLEDKMYIGSNLLHEHGHNCGFDHDFYATSRRENSLCRILNRSYERAFRKIYGLPEPVVKYYTPWYKRLALKIRSWF